MKEASKLMCIEAFCRDFELRSTKVFNKNTKTEMPNPKAYICNTYKCLESDANAIYKTFLLRNDFETNDLDFYDLPIWTKAKELGPCDDEMCIPLNEKELILICKNIFHRDDDYYSCIILYGEGGTGKSTFLNVIRQLYGSNTNPNNVCNMSLQDSQKEFSGANLCTARVWMYDDIPNEDFNQANWKNITTKNPIRFNEKYGLAKNYAKIQCEEFFSCNQPPKFNLNDDGLFRRVCYYWKNQKIQEGKGIVGLDKKRFTDNELITILRNALRYDYLFDEKRSWFHQYFENDTRNILRENNSVHLFNIAEEYNKLPKSYTNYVEFCKSKGLKPFSEPNFTKIKSLFNEWDGVQDLSFGEDIF